MKYLSFKRNLLVLIYILMFFGGFALIGVYETNNPEIVQLNGCDYLKTYKGYGNVVLKHSPDCKKKKHMSYAIITYK